MPIDEAVHDVKMKFATRIRDNNAQGTVYDECEWCQGEGKLLYPGEENGWEQCTYCAGYGLKIYYGVKVNYPVNVTPTPEEVYDEQVYSNDLEDAQRGDGVGEGGQKASEPGAP